jgi:uncharacterized protein YndB with AHSA1/START domain
MSIVGLWHITEMEVWDEAYFNMVGQAFIQIKGNRLGNFQFGLVSGQLDGEFEKVEDEERFYFTWDGSDEMDPVSGSGWLKLVNQNRIEGKIKLHLGDSSLFWAKRVK